MRIGPALITTAVAALCLAQPLIAQSVDEIQSQAEAGDADSQGLLSWLIQVQEVDLSGNKAVELAQESAKAGSPFGSYALGRIYEKGYGGVSKDADEATAQFIPAVPSIRARAEAGNSWAALLMSGCLLEGRGAEKDPAESLKWLRRASEQGVARAQISLGVAYFKGEGIEKDLAEAVKWFRKAAEQGNAQAQYNLATAYFNGEGLKKDPVEAAKWWRKAAEQGNVHAQLYLGLALMDKAFVSVNEGHLSAATDEFSEGEKLVLAAKENSDGDSEVQKTALQHMSQIEAKRGALKQIVKDASADGPKPAGAEGLKLEFVVTQDQLIEGYFRENNTLYYLAINMETGAVDPFMYAAGDIDFKFDPNGNKYSQLRLAMNTANPTRLPCNDRFMRQFPAIMPKYREWAAKAQELKPAPFEKLLPNSEIKDGISSHLVCFVWAPESDNTAPTAQLAFYEKDSTSATQTLKFTESEVNLAEAAVRARPQAEQLLRQVIEQAKREAQRGRKQVEENFN